MSTTAFQNQLQTKATKDLKGALEALLQGVKSTSNIHIDALNLLGQYHQLQREKITGIIATEQADLRFRQLLNGFLQLVDLVSEEDLSETPQVALTYYIDQSAKPIALNLTALEQEGLRRQAELIMRKLNKLKEALLLAADASVQFKYEEEIEKLEAQLKKVVRAKS